MSERPARKYAPRLDTLRDAVRDAARTGRTLWLRGGNTLAADPPAAAIDLQVPPADELVEYWPDDMTVRAPAGMTLARLHELLAATGRELPIDAPAPHRTTVGGLIATGLCGSRRLARGTVRDTLLGLTLIDANAELLEFGGRVVKNVAGYDVCKLLLGSWGCLALIVDGTFRVRARPEASRALLFEPAHPAAAESWCAALLASPLAPASIDWIDGDLAGRWNLSGHPSLIVGFEGLREDVDGRLRRTRALLSASGALLEREPYAHFRERLADLALCPHGCIRLSLPSGDVMHWVNRLRDLQPHITAAAHLASGILLLEGSAAAPPSFSRIILECEERRAAFFIPRQPPGPAPIAMTHFPAEVRRLLRGVKSAFDPRAVFGRGSRFAHAAGFDAEPAQTP